MTTTATHAEVTATANGTTPIPFTFQAVSAAEVGVTRNGVEQVGGYTVSLNSSGTGSVIPSSSWGSDTVVVYSKPSFQQNTNFTRLAKWYPDQMNAPLDRLARTSIALRGYQTRHEAKVNASLTAMAASISAATTAQINAAVAAISTGPQGPPGDIYGVATRAALAAIAGPTNGSTVFLKEAGREGTFVFRTGDYSAQVTADAQQGIYVAPQGQTGSGGAWVRQSENAKVIRVAKFGVSAGNSEATNTAIISAILAANLPGNLTLIFPDGTIPCRVRVPVQSASYLSVVRIKGENAPPTWFGTVALGYTAAAHGTVLTSTTTATVTYAGGVIEVLGPSQFEFSNVKLIVEDLQIRLPDNPNQHGIMAYNAQQLEVRNCQIDTPVWSVNSADPTNTRYGIRTPQNGNGAWIKLEDISIVGFKVGFEVNEHTVANNVAITSCYYAMEFAAANHASKLGRICIQRCRHAVLGSGVHRFSIAQLNLEHANSTTNNANGGIDIPGNVAGSANGWQVTVSDIEDPVNRLKGDIRFSSVLGGFGNNAEITVNGGTGLDISEISEPLRTVFTPLPYIADHPTDATVNSILSVLRAQGLVEAVSGFFDPTFTLTNVVESPDNVFTRNAGATAWNAKAQAGPFTGDMEIIYKATDTGTDAWAGFASNSAALANTQGEAAVYYDGTLSYAYTGATDNGFISPPAYSSTTLEKFQRIGSTIKFFRDGTLMKTWTVPSSTPLYFILALAVAAKKLTFVSAENL